MYQDQHQTSKVQYFNITWKQGLLELVLSLLRISRDLALVTAISLFRIAYWVAEVKWKLTQYFVTTNKQQKT